MTDTTTTPAELDIPIGAPVWMDLTTSDMDKTADFYGRVFGWTANETPPEFGGYRYFLCNGKAVGGAMVNDPTWNMPDGWTIYLRTDDCRKTAELAKENGGSVLMEPMDVFTNGSFVVTQDAGGAVISAWQPGTEKGFGVLMEENTPVHFELHTREYEKSVAFYESVFGWMPHTMADEPEFRYTTFSDEPENARAGIMDATAFLPEGVPAHWSVYIGVADVDQTLTTIESCGGAVVSPAMDTPYGRLAAATDATGAMFKLRS